MAKNLELCKAWDAAQDAILDLNTVFFKALHESPINFDTDHIEALPFTMKRDLSDQACALLTQQLGEPTRRI